MINKKIVIGITDCSKWENYARWFRELPYVELIKLTYKENNFSDIQKCDGIVLSGGEDVHPKFYNKPEYLSILNPEEIKQERDEFELKLIEKTLKQKKPLLGICRGLQIANVYFGGTLIPDIPGAGKSSHSKVQACLPLYSHSYGRQGYDKLHLVNISDDSILKNFIGKDRGEVNSAHHQSAAVIAGDLKVNAVSDDGIIEGMEWKNPGEKPFLLLVQWHPERMKDAESPFSKNIRDKFVAQICGIATPSE